MAQTEIIVQYIVLRKDLIKSLGWSLGAAITQCCHATTATSYIFRDDIVTQKYFSDLDNMHKIVLEANNEEALKNLSKVLNENNILHKLWIEQPENIPTCLAIKPYPKDEVKNFVKKFNLYKS